MGTTLTYRHEDGINWNSITPDLIVGSCLQTPEDADRLAAAGITTVFSLQVWWGWGWCWRRGEVWGGVGIVAAG